MVSIRWRHKLPPRRCEWVERSGCGLILMAERDVGGTGGGRFPSPECKAADFPLYGTARKTWRHLDVFQHQAFLHARTPRITCSKCGVRQVEVPWARPCSGFTLLFEALAMTLVRHMPVSAAAGDLVDGAAHGDIALRRMRGEGARAAGWNRLRPGSAPRATFRPQGRHQRTTILAAHARAGLVRRPRANMRTYRSVHWG